MYDIWLSRYLVLDPDSFGAVLIAFCSLTGKNGPKRSCDRMQLLKQKNAIKISSFYFSHRLSPCCFSKWLICRIFLNAIQKAYQKNLDVPKSFVIFFLFQSMMVCCAKDSLEKCEAPSLLPVLGKRRCTLNQRSFTLNF